jgi:hypothetical protein
MSLGVLETGGTVTLVGLARIEGLAMLAFGLVFLSEFVLLNVH